MQTSKKNGSKQTHDPNKIAKIAEILALRGGSKNKGIDFPAN